MSNHSNTLAMRAPSKAYALALPTMHVVFRVGAGFLFLQHGVQKLFGLLGGIDGAGATAPLFSLYGAAGVLELFGGLLIVLGLLTRPVALLLALEMVTAFFIAHAPQGGFPIQNGGELALLYTMVFALLAGAGAGGWSLDGLIRSRITEQ
ncbi:MAG: DoxX family protein [Rhodothermales bacterium]